MKMHSLLAFALTMQTAFATSFYIRPFSEFTKSTSNIVRGKISNIHTENSVDHDGVKTIYTFANLELKEVIKGNLAGSQIQIRKLGGSKDGVTLEIPSSVEFTEKEEGVFFLSEELDDHSYEVSSLELGKFNLVKKNGEEILKGGIFNYSQPHPGDDHDVMGDNIEENLKPWSIRQLKELVHAQQSSGIASSPTEKNTNISKPSAELTPSIETKTSPIISSNPPIHQKKPVSEENENSPLYFNSSFWYSLAIVFLTLGVIFFIRRK